ncbi:2-keto-4-pentenoate hydratase [Micromonospora sp. NPDC005163]
MREVDRATAADLLVEARRLHQPINPLTERFPDLTVEDAYEIQARQTQQRLDSGRVIKGRKVGLTSAAMQRQLGVSSPDFGVLFDDMFFPEHEPIAPALFLQPRIEPEVAFVLKRDLQGPGVTVADAVRAVDFVLPALEIIDSRIADWRITIADTIADNASSGGVVLGGSPARLAAVDLRLMGGNLFGNGDLVATGAGGAVLGSPLLSLVWLANTLGDRNEGLRAGDVVLPGSITSAQPVRPGDTWSAHFAGLGSVTTCFAKEAR